MFPMMFAKLMMVPLRHARFARLRGIGSTPAASSSRSDTSRRPKPSKRYFDAIDATSVAA
jgi:hypothetical protein